MKNLFLFTVFASLIVLWWCSQREAQEQEQNTSPSMEVSAEHCKMMPDMPGCEQYRTTWDIETGSKWQNDHNTTWHTMTMNHADMVSDELSFISEMIPHHQEAVDTSTTLLAKTQNPKLKTMLENIIKGQAKEITMMKGRLSDYHAGSDYKATYMPMMRDTSTVSAITTLEKMYIEDMIAHHQWAVDMAIKLLDIMHKQDPVIKLTEAGMKHRNEVKAFAQAIIQDQTREIAEFVQLLKAY
jgi:uncharacterized protein (DUF305 family)